MMLHGRFIMRVCATCHHVVVSHLLICTKWLDPQISFWSPRAWGIFATCGAPKAEYWCLNMCFHIPQSPTKIPQTLGLQ